MHKIGQSGGLLGRIREPLLKMKFPLIETVLKPLAKSVFIPLGLTAAAEAVTYPAIYKKTFHSGTTTSIVSNEELNDIIKMVKSLEESGFLRKGISKTIRNEVREQKVGFVGMLFGT